MSTTSPSATDLEKAMRDQLLEEVDKSYGNNFGRAPTPAERQEAMEAIDELLENIDIEGMHPLDLQDLAIELGISRNAKPGVDVDDRRKRRPS